MGSMVLVVFLFGLPEFSLSNPEGKLEEAIVFHVVWWDFEALAT